jgi:hypothetical protein
MNIKEFFDSPAVSLPKTRQNADFVAYLQEINAAYLDAVDQLQPACLLGGPIRAARQTIMDLGIQIAAAAEQYLDGRPAAAYTSLEAAIGQVQAVDHLISLQVPPHEMPVVYRMTSLTPNALNRGRIFHIPFHLRHLVGRHRYGIPGFPCLYLGGSLRQCQEECETPYHELHKMGLAAFRFRELVRILDFGYGPAFIGKLGEGRLLAQGHPNPGLDALIVNYAICWPLIAACSVKRMQDGKFAAEYTIPHLVLQWVMEQGQCDGIRFFSTKVPPDPDEIRSTMNYVFPARLPAVNGYSQRLRDLFEMTDPIMWRGMGFFNRLGVRLGLGKWRMRLARQFQDNTSYIQTRPMTQL